MTSMYDTLMDLPIFKGASRDQISLFLEKTHISFLNYQDKETIISRASSVDTIKFIISGKVKISHFIGDGEEVDPSSAPNPIILSEICSTGVLICGDYIFGMETNYPVEVISMGKSSILEFGKEQFFSILRSDPLYAINYLNYLSYQSQKASYALRILSDASIEHRLALFILSLTSSRALEIEITYNPSQLSRITGLNETSIESALDRLQRKRLLRYTPASILIPSRRNFLDFIFEEQQA